MEKIVNNTKYEVIKDHVGVLDIKATVGVHEISVIFSCFEIEWHDDFPFVQKRLRDILTNSIHAV